MSTILSTATGVAGNVGNRLQQTTSRVSNRLQITTDRLVSPEQRREILKRLHLFATHNPKLAAFIGAQVILTGIPLVIFLVFAVATLFVSLTTCVLLGIIIALSLGFFAIGIALLFLIPTIFVASCSATFIFLWGLLGYVVLRRFNRIDAFEKRGSTTSDRPWGVRESNASRPRSWNGNGNGRLENLDEQPLSAKRPVGSEWNQSSDGMTAPQDTKDHTQPDNLQNLSMGNAGRTLTNPGTPSPLMPANASGDSSHGNGGPVNAIDGTQEWEDKWKAEAKGNSKKQQKKEAWKKRMDERREEQR